MRLGCSSVVVVVVAVVVVIVIVVAAPAVGCVVCGDTARPVVARAYSLPVMAARHEDGEALGRSSVVVVVVVIVVVIVIVVAAPAVGCVPFGNSARPVVAGAHGLPVMAAFHQNRIPGVFGHHRDRP